MTAAVVMDNRKRPLDVSSPPFGGTDSPAKRLQIDSTPVASAVPNGIHTATAARTQRLASESNEEEEEELSPAYKGLEVSSAS